jgi:hypothetical protein
MRSIWIAIDPRPTGTRVLAQAGPAETLLKARLTTDPKHPRALPTLLEAIALWEGTEVRAALVVGDEAATSGTRLFLDSFAELAATPLYSLEHVVAARRRRRRDGLDGMGDFRDLRQLLLFEVAR